MLDAAQLASIQQTANASLDIAGASVQRATTTDDGYGHLQESWSTIATVAAGLAKPSAGIMVQFAGALAGSVASWIVSLPVGTDVARNDRLLVAGLTLRVQADLTQSSYSALTQVLATELR